MLRGIYEPGRDEVIAEWRRLQNEGLRDLYSSLSNIRVIKSRSTRWAGYVDSMGEKRGGYRVLLGKSDGKRPLGRPTRKWEDNIKLVKWWAWTHQLLAYAGDVNVLRGSIHTLKENAEALVAATREIGLEVCADKTKYMVMSRDQTAGRIHSVRTDNSTFERVEGFKYWGTTLTNQNSVPGRN